ncbi:hypothetical protein AAG895_06375 [Thauera sp. JM12B12]|uniref:hypothetical protein n=1 Tax=Thauera sp. JM12B12 TaxID=3142262 RepID=UPI0031F35831
MTDHDRLLQVIEALRAEVRALGGRIATLESRLADVAQAPEPAGRPPEADAVSEEEMLAISAAIAAFLGVRAHIRQVRLVHSATWAQVGRVHIQASHRVH